MKISDTLELIQTQFQTFLHGFQNVLLFIIVFLNCGWYYITYQICYFGTGCLVGHAETDILRYCPVECTSGNWVASEQTLSSHLWLPHNVEAVLVLHVLFHQIEHYRTVLNLTFL